MQVLHEGWRPVSLSKLDKAAQIEVNRDLDRASSRKGYRMVTFLERLFLLSFPNPKYNLHYIAIVYTLAKAEMLSSL